MEGDVIMLSLIQKLIIEYERLYPDNVISITPAGYIIRTTEGNYLISRRDIIKTLRSEIMEISNT